MAGAFLIWRGFMKTRNTSYRHYGITDDEVKEWIAKCRNADNEFKKLIMEAARESNETLAEQIVESLNKKLSYTQLSMKEYIPLSMADFYGYKRKTVFLLKEKVMERDEKLQAYFKQDGVIRRYVREEDACSELMLSKVDLARLAAKAKAAVKFGNLIRIDMNALYAYVDKECTMF